MDLSLPLRSLQDFKQISAADAAHVKKILILNLWCFPKMHSPAFGILLASVGEEMSRMLPCRWVCYAPPPRQVSPLLLFCCSLKEACPGQN